MADASKLPLVYRAQRGATNAWVVAPSFLRARAWPVDVWRANARLE
jgi:hypothetical protein